VFSTDKTKINTCQVCQLCNDSGLVRRLKPCGSSCLCSE